jgi:hypothetical protein
MGTATSRLLPLGAETGGVKRLSERQFLRLRRQHRAFYSKRIADRLKRPFAGIEQTRVAHRIANSLGSSDDLRIATGSSEHAIYPSVENRDDLSQPRHDGNLSDASQEFPKRKVDAVLTPLWLAVRYDSANPRAFPNCRAFDRFPFTQ